MLDWLKAARSRTQTSVALVSPWLQHIIWNISHQFLSLAKLAFGQSPIVYACLRLLCQSVAEAPLAVEILEHDNESSPAPIQHPLARLIRRPNPLQTQYEMIEMITQHLGIVGRSHWWKRRNLAGDVIELWPLRPDRVGPIYGPTAGNPVLEGWTYVPPGLGQPIRLPAADVMTFNFPDPSGETGGIVEGLGPLQVLAREIEADNEATAFVAALLKNAATPGVVIKTKAQQLPREVARRIKRAFMDEYGGARRGEPAVIDGDSDIIPLSFSLQQLEFPNLRHVSESRVAAAIGVPAILVGLEVGLDAGIKATISDQRRFFTETTLASYWRRIEDQFTLDLAAEFDESGLLIVRFDTTQVQALIEISKQEASAVADAFTKGAATLDEYRERVLGLPPLPGQAGEVLYIPTNMLVIPIDQLLSSRPVQLAVMPGWVPAEAQQDDAALSGGYTPPPPEGDNAVDNTGITIGPAQETSANAPGQPPRLNERTPVSKSAGVTVKGAAGDGQPSPP